MTLLDIPEMQRIGVKIEFLRYNFIYFQVDKSLGKYARNLLKKLGCSNSNPYFWTGPNLISNGTCGPIPSIFKDSTIQVSSVCNPDFVDSRNWNCTQNYDKGNCNDTSLNLLFNAVKNESGYETILNCPECGCHTTAEPLPIRNDLSIGNITARIDNYHGRK